MSDEYQQSIPHFINNSSEPNPLKVDMRPLCADYDPEMWFPEAIRGAKTQPSIDSAVTAMKICTNCPIQQACLRLGLTDQDAIAYGIYGGTLPYERLEEGATSTPMGRGYDYQRKIRQEATRQGVVKPTISKAIPSPRVRKKVILTPEEQREKWRKMRSKSNKKYKRPSRSKEALALRLSMSLQQDI